MSEGLIASKMKVALEEIISFCFYSNRIVDRMCSVLETKFMMDNTSNILHHDLAHLYPILADDISDYMGDRGCTVIYGETPEGDSEYENPIDCFNDLLSLSLDLEVKVKEAIKVAQEIEDYSTKVYLERFLYGTLPITASILHLIDKANMYGDGDKDLMRLDQDVEGFGLFEAK